MSAAGEWSTIAVVAIEVVAMAPSTTGTTSTLEAGTRQTAAPSGTAVWHGST
jgi:hypothetical protein